jgi:hypothetical protein
MTEAARRPLPPAADHRVPAMDMHELVEASQRRRLGVSVCDHNEIRGSIKLWETGRVVTLPALEIGSLERLEFLCYFPAPELLEEYFVRHVEPFKRHRFFAKLTKSFTYLIPAAKEMGALVGLPHPFAPGWKNFNFNARRREKLIAPSFMRQVDLVEVINSHLPDNRNFKAFMLSEIMDKSVIAGSDAHRITEVGAAYLSFGRPMNADEIFRLLRRRIKVGSDERFKFTRTAGTSRGVIASHIKLYLSRKKQNHWMLRYDDEVAYDPAVMPDRRSGYDRRRKARGPERRKSEE